jgi:hypothetical protein
VRRPTPLRETDVTEGGMGGGGAIALLVPLSSAIVDGLSHVFREEISVRRRPHVGITR